jgi:hypothetical protein
MFESCFKHSKHTVLSIIRKSYWLTDTESSVGKYAARIVSEINVKNLELNLDESAMLFV